jgi:hypothetical protein
MKVTISLVSMVNGKVLRIVAETPVTIGINASPNITRTRLIKAVFAGILFSEISMPTRTPDIIRLIVEIHRIRSSYSLPITFNSLNKYSKMETKANTEINHATFFVCIVS